ncbi:MAG: hypothetical protein KatS3mg027_2146 [Bacteroidia bacterium]|nr:MAG: hypothetical protein KatS3mg027_2146 [Bacteroidia bacterium]
MENKHCYIIIIILFFLLKVSYSQSESYVKKGVIKSTATISSSKILSRNLSPFYIHGLLEYYTEDNVSVAGEGYYYLGDWADRNSPLGFHHSLFFGANYHWVKKNNDMYLGFLPGISFTRINTFMNTLQYKKVSFNPLLGLNIGYNYYVGKYFHFFIQNKWVFGENINLLPLNLSDFRISAGLGFNLSLLK